MSITLSAAQLREVLEFIAPDVDQDEEQLENEATIQHLDARISIEGEFMPAGYYAWITEYPEEGCIGPLGMPAEEVIRLQEEHKSKS